MGEENFDKGQCAEIGNGGRDDVDRCRRQNDPRLVDPLSKRDIERMFLHGFPLPADLSPHAMIEKETEQWFFPWWLVMTLVLVLARCWKRYISKKTRKKNGSHKRTAATATKIQSRDINASAFQEGESQLLEALDSGHVGRVRQVLTKYASIIQPENKMITVQMTPLEVACDRGHVAVVQHLIESNRANFNPIADCTCDLQGNQKPTAAPSSSCSICHRGEILHNPLLIACRAGHTSVVRYLLQTTGAKPYSRRERSPETLISNSLIGVACERGHLSVVKELVRWAKEELAKGDKDNFEVDWKWGLCVAVISNKLDIAHFLLESDNTDVNFAIFHSRQVPLCVAAACGNLEMVSLLVNRGANVNFSSNQNGTPLFFALSSPVAGYNNRGDSRTLLELVSASQGSMLGCHRRVALYLLQKGADPHHPGSYEAPGRRTMLVTPWILSVAKGELDLVRLMMEQRRQKPLSSSLESCKNAEVALHTACRFGHTLIVEYFVQQGFDFRRTLLYRNGDDNENRTDRIEHSAISIAVAYHHYDTVWYLIRQGWAASTVSPPTG